MSDPTEDLRHHAFPTLAETMRGLRAEMEQLTDEADAETIRGLREERDAYRRAKQENDERFQLEAAEWRERCERLRADVEEFAESLVEQGDEHVQGCMGQADCAACVRHDLRAILARDERPEGEAEGDALLDSLPLDERMRNGL